MRCPLPRVQPGGAALKTRTAQAAEGSPPGGRRSPRVHTVSCSKPSLLEAAGRGLSPVTDDVEPYSSVIGLAEMTRGATKRSWLKKIDLRLPSGQELGTWVYGPTAWCEGMDQKPSQGAALLPLLQLLWLLPESCAVPAAHTLVWRDDLQNHTFRHTVFCQEGAPSIGLSESYDEDQLFSFDFSESTRVPRLPEFADWAKDQSDASAIAFDKGFCKDMVQQLDPFFDGQIPVSRGFPVPEVFTLKPLEFGKPNTLVCFVSNLFPPMLTVNWQHNSEPVEGVGPTFVSAIGGLSFQAFSYLNFTPEPSDLFTCLATHEIDGYTAVAYWVPHNAVPSDLLENVLCGVAFGLGVLGIIVGIVLIVYFQRPCSGD